MAFPDAGTFTNDGTAAAALTSRASAAGLDLSGLGPIGQLQSAVANLLVSDPTTVAVPAGNVLSGTFGANKAGGADTGTYTFPGALTVTGAATFSSTVRVNGAASLGTAAGVNQTVIDGTGFGAGVASLRLNGLTTAAISNQVGTLTNAPTAGNPTFWAPISIAGAIRYVPCWS